MLSRPARAVLTAALLALSSTTLRAQGAGDDAPATSVLLVTLEATRADRLGCYGHAAAHTPTLDALAAAGARFERAYTHAPLSLPAHASILSGRTPLEHGVHDDGRYALGSETPLLAEAFQARGYRTGAFLGSIELKAPFGLARGIETYADDLGAPDDLKELKRKRAAREVVRAAASWLVAEDARPFFCWIQLGDLCAPRSAPRGERREGADDYDAVLSELDAALGLLMQALEQNGLAERTLVVVLGSMGEGLGEHGEQAHGALVWDSTLRVPLIVRAPMATGAGRVLDTLVGHADLAPTLCELLGYEPLAGATGASYAAVLRGEPDPAAEREVYFESERTALAFGWSTLRGLVRGEWKYVRAPEPSLYHVTADPGETTDLAGQETARVEELAAALAGRIAAGGERAAPVSAIETPETRRLSGIDSEPPRGTWGGPPPEGAGVDPRERLEALEAYDEVLAASYSGARASITTPMERAVAASPDTAALHVLLAIAYERARRFEEAKTELELALELDPSSSTANYYLARMMIQTGQPELCEGYYQLAAEQDPGSYRAQLAMAQRLVQQQRLEESVPYLMRLCYLKPDQLANWNQLLVGLRSAGRWADIVAVAGEAAERFPENLFLANYHAWTLATAPDADVRDPGRAATLAKQLAERTEMKDPGVLDTLAAAQAAGGDFETAKRTLQKAILIAHEHKIEPLLTDMRARLELYQKGTPYRDG